MENNGNLALNENLNIDPIKCLELGLSLLMGNHFSQGEVVDKVSLVQDKDNIYNIFRDTPLTVNGRVVEYVSRKIGSGRIRHSRRITLFDKIVLNEGYLLDNSFRVRNEDGDFLFYN